ncbi:MAG: hemolysin family protein [Bauldia sp.]
MPIIEIAIVVLLVLLNGLLAMSELAIVSARRSKLRTLAEGGNRGASKALDLIADPSRFLAVVQIGITLVGIVAGAFSGATIAERLGSALDAIAWIAPHGNTVAIAVVVAAITYLSLIIGELVPKRIALANPERAATLVAGPMRALSRVAAPVVWLLRHSTDAILRLLGLHGVRQAAVSEDEIKVLIAEGTRAGVFAPQEREMIEGVLRLADRSVRAIMTPRASLDWVDASDESRTVVEAIAAGRHTRILVCEGSIDHARGFVDARDILPLVLGGGAIDLPKSMRRLLVVSEQTPVLALIDLFRREAIHFALVVDEYGTTQGVVTATDLLEAVAGDLPEQGEPAGPAIVRRADGSFLVDGMLAIDEFADHFGLRDLRTGGDYETVAGFVIDRLGRLPDVGDRLVHGSMTLEVVDMDGRRIDKVLVTLPEAGDEGSG